jgi:hypothetical protein
MINLEVVVVRAALSVCNLAGRARGEEWIAREWQECNAECRKFGTETARRLMCLLNLLVLRVTG